MLQGILLVIMKNLSGPKLLTVYLFQFFFGSFISTCFSSHFSNCSRGSQACSYFLWPSIKKWPHFTPPCLEHGVENLSTMKSACVPVFQIERRANTSGSPPSPFKRNYCVFYKPGSQGWILVGKITFFKIFIKWRNEISSVWNWLIAKCLKN